ncbi:Membrane protein involved in the export of O-antigen and teichoic acid [Geoglobus ahangari]|uniref:Membrane protein involved in the export of O-antigen and teichoic acid n=1 Tax=Geoglobus ahangari TaxID=113653 RepID=A0A0F7DBK3_9EURY|nr:Membrane protein involved in the export of O-antigen and teichoic acid [Geoglobus ahangari]
MAKKVAKNALYNSSAILIGNISGIIITVFLARALGPVDFGIYSLTISIALLIISLTDFGINQTVIRYVSDAIGKREISLARGYIRELGKIKAILAVIVSASLVLLSDILSTNVFHKPDLSLPLKVVSGFVLFYPISGFLIGIFNGLNDFRANFVKSSTYEFFRATTIITLVTLGYSVVGAIFGFVVASLASLLSLAILLLKKYKTYVIGKAEKIDILRVLRFTGYLTISGIAWTVFTYVDSVMIGTFLPAEYVGYYRASYTIIGAVAGILSLPVVLFPVFVQLGRDDLKNAFNRVFKYSAMIAVPASFGLPAISKEIVLAIYGPEYLSAVPVFWILSFLILRSAVGFWGVIFNAKEMPEYPVKVILLGMALNILLNYLMIPKFGIIGAAIATIASNMVVWCILAYLSKIHFDVFFTPSHLLKPIVASLVMVAFLVTFSPTSIVEGVLMILIGVAVYFVTLYIIKGVKKEDLKYLIALIRK